LRKAYLDTVIPAEETVESAWAKLRGSLLHYAGRSLGWNELAVKLTIKIGAEDITIIGFIDAYDPETATIYDLKTTRFVKWQAEKSFIPRDSHIAQVQCYATMLENYGIPVDRLVLVYVDDKDIVPIQIPLGNRREWMIRRASQLHQAFTKETEPTPEVGSQCKYCPHRSACSQGEGIKFEVAMN
jgi:CRISPR/Cas system-associated exonuclease Cas4 (RecB family)